MFPRHTHRLTVGGVLLAAAIVLGLATSASAADLKKDSSLGVIPADASFYSTTLRNKEQLELFYNSNAYKTLRELPFVKDAWKEALKQMEKDKGGNPLEIYKQITKDKSTKELIDVVLEGMGEEVFIYGGKTWSDLLSVYAKLSYAQYLGTLDAAAGNDPGKAPLRAIARMLQKNKDKLKIPELVIGIKLKDDKKIIKQLPQLFGMLKAVINADDGAKAIFGQRVNQVKVAGGEFITVDVDGSMLPWDQFNPEDIEEEKGEFEALFKHIKGSKITASVGVLKGNLLIGLTASTKELETLAGSGKLLADRDELKPVFKNPDRKFVEVSYVSKDLQKAFGGERADLLDFLSQAKEKIGKLQVLKEEHRKGISNDIEALITDIKRLPQHEPGGMASFAFLTKTGYEGFDYNYGDHTFMKNVKCTLHKHFGGDPLVAAAFAFPCDGTYYKLTSKYIAKVYDHFETIFLDSADADSKDRFQQFTKTFLPLVKKLDDTTKKQMIPALEKTGLGLVIDAKWKSKRWQKDLPETKEALAMPEIGLLLGMSDDKKFTGAIREYRRTLNDLFAAARESAPNKDNIPEVRIPAPLEEDGKNKTTLYVYPIPEDAGLDKQFAPTAAVGKTLSVLTLSRGHTERLMASTPLKIKSGPLSRKGDMVGCMVVDFSGLVDVALPGVEYAMKSAILIPGDDEKKGKEKVESLVRQVKVVAQVLKTFKHATSATYVEGKHLVTHKEIIIQDLESVVHVKE